MPMPKKQLKPDTASVRERMLQLMQRNGTGTCWTCGDPCVPPTCKRCQKVGVTNSALAEYAKLNAALKLEKH